VGFFLSLPPSSLRAARLRSPPLAQSPPEKQITFLHPFARFFSFPSFVPSGTWTRCFKLLRSPAESPLSSVAASSALSFLSRRARSTFLLVRQFAVSSCSFLPKRGHLLRFVPGNSYVRLPFLSLKSSFARSDRLRSAPEAPLALFSLVLFKDFELFNPCCYLASWDPFFVGNFLKGPLRARAYSNVRVGELYTSFGFPSLLGRSFRRTPSPGGLGR